jgi:hypothetical protein
MKKFFALIIALVISASAVYAVDFNAKVTDNAQLKAKVITPFSIEKSSATTLPPVINGQNRIFSPGINYQLFTIKREPGYTVWFNFVIAPYPVDGVKVGGSWVMMNQNVDLEKAPGAKIDEIPASSLWQWDLTDNDIVYVNLRIDNIDATLATSSGPKSFTATMTGYYNNL